jgi:nitrite reductase/ring-hydroxylating ferredoxin subunit
VSDAVRGVVLGRLADIADGDSAGFVVVRSSCEGTPAGVTRARPRTARADGERIGVLAVRRGARVFAYVNSCPHTGAPLDFRPGRFLSLDKTLIQCSTHGALFRIEDGFCLKGPCAGKSLVPVPVVVEDGALRLAEWTDGTSAPFSRPARDDNV